MTKRWLDDDCEAKRAEEKSRCGCFYNWNDNFEELCEHHQAEADEAEREYQWSLIPQQ